MGNGFFKNKFIIKAGPPPLENKNYLVVLLDSLS
eukprot:SAG31_NODE_12184_length_960_cov_2.041812_2_plen_33_part_01